MEQPLIYQVRQTDRYRFGSFFLGFLCQSLESLHGDEYPNPDDDIHPQ